MDKPADDTVDGAQADEALARKPLTPRELEKIARGQARIDSGWAIYGPELDQFFHDLRYSDQPVKVPAAKRLPSRG
jgi:hypothetical protein